MSLFEKTGKKAPPTYMTFKCGILNKSGLKMTPDPRRGMLCLEQGDGEVLNLVWRERPSLNPIAPYPLILFPNDVKITRIPESKPVPTVPGKRPTADGRCFALNWTRATKTLYFWMQEADESKDHSTWQKFVHIINDPSKADIINEDDDEIDQKVIDSLARRAGIDPALLRAQMGLPPAQRSGTSAPAPSTSQVSSSALDSAMEAAFGASSTTAPTESSAASSETPSSSSNNTGALSSILDNFSASALGNKKPNVRLSDILTRENVLTLVKESPAFLERLYEFMPPQHRDPEHVEAFIRSTEFKSTVAKIDILMNTHYATHFLQQFKLPVPSSGSGSRAVIDAIIEAFKSEQDDEESKNESGVEDAEEDGEEKDPQQPHDEQDDEEDPTA